MIRMKRVYNTHTAIPAGSAASAGFRLLRSRWDAAARSPFCGCAAAARRRDGGSVCSRRRGRWRKNARRSGPPDRKPPGRAVLPGRSGRPHDRGEAASAQAPRQRATTAVNARPKAARADGDLAAWPRYRRTRSSIHGPMMISLPVTGENRVTRMTQGFAGFRRTPCQRPMRPGSAILRRRAAGCR